MTTYRKLRLGILLLIVLSVCLCFTTFALVYSTLSVEGNLFASGKISIDLNGGAPIVKDDGLYLAPGVPVDQEFYLQNTGTGSVYYKMYFENVSGSLADDIYITVRKGEDTLYSGKAKELSKDQVLSANDLLLPEEKRTLTVTFLLSKEANNALQRGYFHFDLRVDAVQADNNPDRLFN